MENEREEETMKVHYTSDGEYPLTGELEEVIGNLRESGMDEKLLSEIARSVETSGKYEGIHDFGHFTIRRLP